MTFSRTIGIEPGLRLGLVVDGDWLVEIRFGDAGESDADHPLLDEAERQLRAYFEGRIREFDLPLKAAGTVFQESVWRMVGAIGYGRTRTYMDLAKELGSPGAVRAVGAANGANPLPVVVPCHRVVATGGGMGGYGGGVELKRRLLALEGAVLI
jgi:methylated-DNA-[protein]-cysteine S-methyltransferase